MCPNNICTHTGSFMFLSDTDIERHWQTGVGRQDDSQQTLLSVSQMPNEEWYLQMVENLKISIFFDLMILPL